MSSSINSIINSNSSRNSKQNNSSISVDNCPTDDDMGSSCVAMIDRFNKKSNKDLTREEKEAKRDIKKELKRKRIQASLDRRLRHAVVRKDQATAQKTREELASMGADVTMRICPNNEAARDFVYKLYVGLKQNQLPFGGSKQSRHVQTNEAVTLLRHMTKGTQDKTMFDNEDALWGYTRQKFQERAMLVYTSCSNLNPSQQPTNLRSTDFTQRKCAWDALTSVKSICSIGCGPACDAVGMIAFLQLFSDQPQLNSLLLLDWAMDKWQILISLLEPLIAPSFVKSIECESGDITKPLDDGMNRSLLKHQQVDLYLFSYILTETRGKWEQFLIQLVDAANSNTMFYFAEPTPWQLHYLRKLIPTLEYIWVDSSMDQSAALQAMDGRLGPGILVARKP
jgi:hypothetical protein